MLRAEKQLDERAIKNLTWNIVSKNYQVYFNNFFTSIVLMVDLKSRNILVYKIIRFNREGLPNIQVADKNKKRTENKF